MLRSRWSLVLLPLAIAGCAAPSPSPVAAAPAREVAPRVASRDPLERGLAALESSRYAEADAAFRAAMETPARIAASVGLSRVLLLTGRYAEARRIAAEVFRAGGAEAVGAVLEALALRRQGKLAEAEASVRRVAGEAAPREARLLLGELLIEQGRRADAEPVLMTLIEDYNQERVAADDAEGLAHIGRAAALLRSPRDANDAFNEAERVVPSSATLLLYRADLYLDNYDLGRAEQVLGELLE
jgi:thioredoxin-like negative regulator of GroEL